MGRKTLTQTIIVFVFCQTVTSSEVHFNISSRDVKIEFFG